MPATCETCRWWSKPPNGLPRGSDGFCHRFPPQMVMALAMDRIEPRAEWPRVSALQWCGEHSAKDDAHAR
ncbi:hypothetical protein [Roseococcus microcysteis]|uniref:hypothetical protein n=1 Tax=Roseococcus microcysteis TaxID=2771361 RepID=UPI00168B4582|nr:hypothetical protein [Roseococcus microcysteis]